MQEQNNDEDFHAWVRQTLGGYRPAGRPDDWGRVQWALRRRQWWRLGLLGLVCVLAGLLVGKWLAETQPDELPRVAGTSPAPPVPAGKETETEAPGPESRNQVNARIPERKAGRSSSRRAAFIRPLIPGVAPLSLRPGAAHLGPASLSWRPPLRLPSFEESAIIHQMRTGAFGPDSTSYQVLARNLRRWPGAVIVCDLTTSMYPYSTQLFAWFRKHTKHTPVQGIVFFTDCDSLGRQTQPGGPPGRMFVTRPGDLSTALPILLEVARNTVANGDGPENDIEALLFAQQVFPEARHLVLVADNGSPVKDISRLGRVDRPVHVVLCGPPLDTTRPFQADYYELAKRTGGSLHTLEDDLTPGVIRPGTLIKVGPRYYRYQARRDRFKVTRFRNQPRRVMGLFWF
jgi:hypothetical protein